MFIEFRHQFTLWALLVALTLLSYVSWAEGSLGDGRLPGTAVIAIAFAKARLIGLDYMELRHAFWPLRALFEAWTVIVALMLIGMFWIAG